MDWQWTGAFKKIPEKEIYARLTCYDITYRLSSYNLLCVDSTTEINSSVTHTLLFLFVKILTLWSILTSVNDLYFQVVSRLTHNNHYEPRQPRNDLELAT